MTNSTNTVETRLVALETKATYQEDTIQTLSDLVSQQQQKIDALEASNTALIKRILSISENFSAINAGEEKPPHY